MISYVFWDWNGTLIDDVTPCVAALNSILRDRGMPEVDDDRYREVFLFPVREYYKVLGMDLQDHEWTQLTEHFHDYYAEHAMDCPLRTGAPEALDFFRSRKIGMSILSASNIKLLEDMIARRGIGHYFDKICGLSDYSANSKLALGQRMIAELSIDPKQLLLIGDTEHDWEVADALGCRCLLIAGGHQAEHRISKCGCDVIGDTTGLINYVLENKL